MSKKLSVKKIIEYDDKVVHNCIKIESGSVNMRELIDKNKNTIK